MKKSKLLTQIDYLGHAFYDKDDSSKLKNPILLKQIHSFEVIRVKKNTDTMQSADALVTCVPGLKLTLRTADCAPVLLADKKRGVIGAAHAGWKGALSGVLETTILEMVRLGAWPSNIVAAIGPCIHVDSYPVDTDMKRLFTENVQPFFVSYPDGTTHFNLPDYVAYRLRRAGVQSVDLIDIDTYTDKHYNSYRRSPSDPARQFSAIWIKG